MGYSGDTVPLLMAPDALETALQVAAIGDGELPHWHRGTADAEPVHPSPLGQEFEDALEAAKRVAAGLPPEPKEEEEEEDAFWD